VKLYIAEFIRDILLATGGTYPSEVYRQLAPIWPRRTTLRAVLRNMAALKAIGLIYLDGERPGTKLLRKRIYRVVPGTENDPRWRVNPMIELYPQVALGSARYRGKTAPAGRSPQYR